MCIKKANSRFYGQEKPGKSHDIFKMAVSRPGKVLDKLINPESFGKVICFTDICVRE